MTNMFWSTMEQLAGKTIASIVPSPTDEGPDDDDGSTPIPGIQINLTDGTFVRLDVDPTDGEMYISGGDYVSAPLPV